MIVGFNHSGFVVKDIEKQIRFYVDVLDLQVIRTFSSDHQSSQHTGLSNAYRELVFLGKPGKDHMLELIQWLSPIVEPTDLPAMNVVGLSHLGLRVDNVDEFYNSLSARGVRFINPPAIREDAVYPRPQKLCSIKDPDGNLIELIELAP